MALRGKTRHDVGVRSRRRHHTRGSRGGRSDGHHQELRFVETASSWTLEQVHRLMRRRKRCRRTRGFRPSPAARTGTGPRPRRVLASHPTASSPRSSIRRLFASSSGSSRSHVLDEALRIFAADERLDRVAEGGWSERASHRRRQEAERRLDPLLARLRQAASVLNECRSATRGETRAPRRCETPVPPAVTRIAQRSRFSVHARGDETPGFNFESAGGGSTPPGAITSRLASPWRQ